ncbi:MAG: hypothetical protein Q8K63_04555, partial [Acidimicrobiales bacterium]|nr:hypothetical protein [Acidimicrobiales bacterium]
SSGFCPTTTHGRSICRGGGRGEPFFVYLNPHVHEKAVDRTDGTTAWRAILADRTTTAFRRFSVDLHPGDIEPDSPPLHYTSRGVSTAEYQQRFGFWSYWNHGPPDQPRVDALRASAARLRVGDDACDAIPVPEPALDLGMVYLRATINPMGGNDADRLAQIDELRAAMQRVVAWVYER